MMYLSEAQALLAQSMPDVQWHGEDAYFSSVGIDSRQMTKGQLFVAIRGEHFDGHDFIAQAYAQGASAVLTSRRVPDGIPNLLVSDTTMALQQLAGAWRRRFHLSLCAITGSNGKTTVTAMLANILRKASADEAVLATQGNLNNHWGVPLTLLRLRDSHRYAVVEMGMNHRGEILALSQLAQPSVSAINNAGSAHLGELGSLEAIARAKGEILAGLSDNGVAVLNGDGEFFSLWQALAKSHRILRFSLHADAEVSARVISPTAFMLHTPAGQSEVRLRVAGQHNVYNALCASAVACALEIPLSAIVEGLSSFDGVKGRLQFLPFKDNVQVIDDTYNANPDSFKVAINVLAAMSGERILILGDMAELGNASASAHEEIGRYAKTQGITRLLSVGQWASLASSAFGGGGKHYADNAQLLADLRENMQKAQNVEWAILVKGSRFMRMERVVQALLLDKGT